MKDTKMIILPIVLLIVGAALGFFGGMKYQQAKAPTSFNGMGRRFGQMGGNGGPNGGMNFRPVVGEILSMDDKSITVKMQDGSSKIALISGSTAIEKTTAGAKSDLATGVRVAVIGTQNSDGSVTATSIQLNPMFRGFGSPMPTPTK